MAYSLFKTPGTQMDIMVLKKYWAKLAGHVERTGCKYKKEDEVRASDGNEYVVLRDVSGNSHHLGCLIGLFYGLEWEYLAEPGHPSEDRFYILIKERRKGKKHVQKDRKKAGPGSKSRNTGKPGDIQSGQPGGAGKSGDNAAGSGGDDSAQLQMFDEEGFVTVYDSHQ